MSASIQDLVRACKSGDLEEVRRIQHNGLILNEQCDRGTSWLHWLMLGVNTSDPVCVQILELLNPGNVNCVADDLAVPGHSQIQKVGSVSPLHLAIHYKGLSVIRKLLELGANPDSQDSNGDTCLIYASREGSHEKVELLLDMGADMLIVNNAGDTALSVAADEGTKSSLTRKLNDKLIKAIRSKREITSLLSSRADPTCSTSDGTPCLNLAIQVGDYNTILELLEQSPPVDVPIASTGNTSLHEAITGPFEASERLELVSELIFLKADVNAKNVSDKTPLDLATESKCSEDLVKLLTDHGAELGKPPATIGRIVRQQLPVNFTGGDFLPPNSPPGDISPRAPDTIDLSEVAGRAGSLLAELQKAREFVSSIGGKVAQSVVGPVEVKMTLQPTEEELKTEKADLESRLVELTSKFDSMKSKNKNISDFRSIGEFLDLQKSIADCRSRIGQIGGLIERGEFRTTNPSAVVDAGIPSPEVTVAAGWFRSPDSIEADIEQCIRTIRKSTNNSINIESAIFEFVRRGGTGGGLRTNEGIPILKLLRNRGSDMNYQGQNFSPFMTVCDLVSPADDEIVDWMLSNGVDLTSTGGDRKWTCLFFAASRGHVRICEKILKRASKSKLSGFADVVDTQGRTAVDYSTNRGVTQLLKTQAGDMQGIQPELAVGS